MKHKTLIRISGIAIILTLLLMLIPVLPAYAANTITLSASSGKIGDSVTVYCSFNDSQSERFAKIYFSSTNVTVGTTSFITSAPSYKYVVGDDVPIDDELLIADNFTVTFTVPASLPATTDPTQGGVTNHNVTSGTYYVLLTYLGSTGTEVGVQAWAAFTVTAPSLNTPSPASGPAGTDVLITGSNFQAGAAITVKLDGNIIPITSGSTVLSTGAIATHVTIPSGTSVSSHIISVTAGGATVSVAFTVTAPAALGALNPASGPPGTHVALSGTNFPANANIDFKFDNTTLTPTGSSTTGTDGSFASILTIPSNATASVHTITVTVGSTVKTATFTVTSATTTPPPTATLNALTPASGPAGTNVAISGANFAASSALAFTFNATTSLTPSGNTQTDANGSFSSVIVIPSDAAAGIHRITVTVGSNTVATAFTVTESTTTPPPPGTTLPLIIDQTGDTIGSTISIAGSGFLPVHAVTVAFDNVTMKEINTNASGGFVSNFLVPPNSQYGAHTISATDGTNTGTAIYTVESTPPGIPQPISPAMGEAISAPASFNWEDVDDASKPITYNMQIATTDTFDANTILLNITGITSSEYTLSDEQQQMLASEIIYYWRERAIDAALNASDWTGAGEFTMIKPFEFIGWPLYTTIGVGGLVLFLLGLWVGRRTAFYY